MTYDQYAERNAHLDNLYYSGKITNEKLAQEKQNNTVAYTDGHSKGYRIAKTILKVVGIILLVGAVGYGLSQNNAGASYYVPTVVKPPCDCPGDTDKDGNQCGQRSAYFRKNGRTPYCPLDRMGGY